MDWINDMFVLSLPVIEKILRPILVYFFLVIGLRLAGKRELAQVSPFDLVVLLTISNTVQNAIIGEDNSLTGGLIGGATLLIVNALVARLIYRYRKLEKVVEGEPDFLIQKGKINQKILEREAITEEELLLAAHKEGILKLEDVEDATIDANGLIVFSAKESVKIANRQNELLERLESLTKEVKLLRGELARANHNGGKN